MEIIGDFPKVFAFKKVISGVLFLEVGFYFKNEYRQNNYWQLKQGSFI
jgi:hypothetical protein